MKSLSQSQLKRLTAVHGWSGTVLGLLLYAVIATGTVVVFASEIAAWSVGGPRAATALSAPLDGKVRPLAEKVSKGYQEEVGVWVDQRGNLRVFPHGHARNPATGDMDDIGTMFHVDATTGEIVARQDGFVWDDESGWEDSALRRFLVDLHVQLYVPEPWGLILTGMLGLLVMGAGVTGFLMHRHLIRDLFVPVRPGERLVTARDRHILAASWALPFAFLLGFTGSYFSFADSVGFPILSHVAFGGDEKAMEETLYEPPVTPDPRGVPMANLDAMLARSVEHTGSEVSYIGIARYGRADSRVSVWHYPPEGSLNYVHNAFNGTDGTFLGTRPLIGNDPSAASVLSGLMGRLHFGDFAGVMSKAVWLGLGTAMCFVILTGLRLWVRRRQDNRLWRGFGRSVTVVSYGLPTAILGCAYAFFLSLPAGDPFWWTPAGFVLTAVVCIVSGFLVADEAWLAAAFRLVLGIGCLALPVLRMAVGGPGWAEAIATGRGAVLSVDSMLLVGGALLLFLSTRSREQEAAMRSSRIPGPAE